MGSPSRDVVTKQIEPFVLPSLASRIIDLQLDPRGGYFALVDVEPPSQDGNSGFIFKFDDAHNVVTSWPFTVFNLAAPSTPALFHLRPSGMSVGPAWIFVVGTVSERALAVPTALFVAKFSLDGSYEWAKVYTPRLFDGCKVPMKVHCSGRSIVRLPAPDDNRLMILFQTSILFDGVGEPRPDDSIAAGVFTIDDDGVVSSQLTRLFGQGQVVPTRLRVLPSFGPTLVGRTRITYPYVGNWQGYWARVDSEGNPVYETGYDLGSNMVLNDIAEHAGVVIAVGDLRGGTAVAFRMNSVGNLHWLGNYRAPLGAEFFSCGIETLLVHADAFIAAGSINPGTRRPWLLRLDPDAPTPLWHKRYDVNDVQSPLIASFYALLSHRGNDVVAGGNIFRRRPQGAGFFVDRIPFLAVSETDSSVERTPCSSPTDISVNEPFPGQIFGSLWMDRMPIDYLDWSGASSSNTFVLETLCSGVMQP